MSVLVETTMVNQSGVRKIACGLLIIEISLFLIYNTGLIVVSQGDRKITASQIDLATQAKDMKAPVWGSDANHTQSVQEADKLEAHLRAEGYALVDDSIGATMSNYFIDSIGTIHFAYGSFLLDELKTNNYPSPLGERVSGEQGQIVKELDSNGIHWYIVSYKETDYSGKTTREFFQAFGRKDNLSLKVSLIFDDFARILRIVQSIS